MTTFIKILIGVSLIIGGESSMAAEGGKSALILASFYPVYIATLNVADGVPGVEVANLTKPTTGCLHDYQLAPQEMKRISEANVFVVNGAGMEAFLHKAVSGNRGMKVIDTSEGIALLENGEHTAGAHKDHEAGRHHADEKRKHSGHHDHDVNPHVWVSISNAIAQVRNIEKGLSSWAPDKSEQFKANANRYIEKLESLLVEMKAGLQPFRGRAIITFHEAFPYFAKEFSFNLVGVIEREPGSQASAKELADTVQLIKKHKVKAVFAEPQYPAKAAEAVARETGIKVQTLDPAVTGPVRKDAYIEIMRKNLASLKTAFR